MLTCKKYNGDVSNGFIISKENKDIYIEEFEDGAIKIYIYRDEDSDDVQIIEI